jgi:hypothetical protein
MKYRNNGKHPVGVLLGDDFVSVPPGVVIESDTDPGHPFVAEDKTSAKTTKKKVAKKAAKKEVTTDGNNDTESSKLG